MKILAADDEILALEMLTDAIRKAYPDAEVYDFFSPSRLFAFAREHPCDIAFLDIRMRGMTGVELARKLKTLSPRINIIFVTSFREYTGDAMDMHASGYIMKPVTAEKIRAEISDLRYQISSLPESKGTPTASWKNSISGIIQPEARANSKKSDAVLEEDHIPAGKEPPLLRFQCFGNFDVFTPDHNLIHFERSRSKELLAYLVYLHGSSCTVREIAAVLFEDGVYDRKQQAYVQKIISSMQNTLRKYRAERIIHKSYNSLALNTALADCDYYDFIRGNSSGTKNAYTGSFMAQYSWAEFMAGYLDRIQRKF